MILPNFFIIGAHKSGTTSLYEYMSQHPSIFMAKVKEPRFFALSEDKIKYSGPNDPAASCEYDTLEKYATLFESSCDLPLRGEASTLYLYHNKAPKNIKKLVPDAKLIAVLRNPMERAYSNYLYALRDGREVIDNFEEALNLEEERIQEKWGPLWHYKRKGLYAMQLERYFKVFNENQIKVIIYDDYKKNPEGICQSIFEFLGVDSSFEPSTGINYNVSGVPKSSSLHQFLLNPSSFRFLYKFIPNTVRKKVKEKLMQINIDRDKEKIPTYDHSTHLWLCDYYEDDIRKLESIIGRDLSFWFQSNSKIH